MVHRLHPPPVPMQPLPDVQVESLFSPNTSTATEHSTIMFIVIVVHTGLL